MAKRSQACNCLFLNYHSSYKGMKHRLISLYRGTHSYEGPRPLAKAIGEATGTATTSQQVVQQHRERLASLAAGGRAWQYLGKALSVDQVDNMEEEEVEKLYGHYEARLGSAMTKTLGAAALQLYTSGASMFLPIPPEEQPELLLLSCVYPRHTGLTISPRW